MSSTRRPPQRPDPGHLIEVAVRYAAHGWPVLPLHTPRAGGCSCTGPGCGSPGKHPRTARGLHEATTDPARIAGWWACWPDANLAVATGAVSGLLVVDVDLPEGPASLARLEADHGPLPATCEQRTGSGGRQLLFTHPADSVGNRARLLAGIDVRGDGGYIVVPPSLHASGARYRWVGRTPPADPPAWLLTLLIDRTRTPATAPRQAPAGPLPAGGRDQRYAAAALHQELTVLASSVEGSRNDTLNRAAFNLGQLVAGGLLEADHVAGELERVATDIGLGPAEIARTVASGLSAAADRPRRPPAPAPPPRQPAAASTSVPVRRVGPRRR